MYIAGTIRTCSMASGAVPEGLILVTFTYRCRGMRQSSEYPRVSVGGGAA